MHARHRVPGNGYRSNAMGMGGVSTASRVSPEGSSMRGHGFYNSNYRNYNRGGFGRGQGKQFQPPQPSRKNDVFMEAGKLAAEYLVSKGILPPNALSGKWQNGSLKNQIGDFLNVRSREGDGLQLSAESRTASHARLGNSGAADIGPGRRRYFDEYDSMGSRNFMGGRRRSGSFKDYGSEWNRELARNGSWPRRTRDSPDMDGQSDTSSGHKGEQQVGKEGDSGMQNFPCEEPPKTDDKSVNDADANKTAISSDPGKSLLPATDVQPTTEAGDMKMSDSEGGEVKNESNIDVVEKKSPKEDRVVEPLAEEDNQGAQNSPELVRLCRFVNVPTKTRSSLTAKCVKLDQDPVSEAKDTQETEIHKGSEAGLKDASVDSSSITNSSTLSHNPKNIDGDIEKVRALEQEQGLACDNLQGSSMNLMNFPRKSVMQEQEGNDILSGFGNSSSTFEERGKKRELDVDDSWEATKKPREWPSSLDAQSDRDSLVGETNSMEKPQASEEPMTSAFDEKPDQKRSFDMSLFPRGDAACIEYNEEKKLFPGSFKTCDLNLMEVCEINENRGAEPVHLFPSFTETEKQAIPIDIDLTMSNNSNATEKYGKCGSLGKDIEVIDLENDSIQESKAFNAPERRAESVFTGLGGFANAANNNNEIPDVPDGYGLMMSELLGNDMPNCSSVPPDMNALHSDMGLQNGEGILGDDDSIYMTLGEIPTSYLRVWEQSSQEYGKPF